jgi:NAD(P)-dependent dehydrogenase (short-subunit alcohol dehydrogenase family)
MRASPESRALLSTGVNLSAKEMRVLVTAGAAGIGRAIAQTFLDHGARVHVCDIDERALAQLPEPISRTRADVANVSEVERLFTDVGGHLGGLDVLVNNAGIAGPTAKVEEIRPEDWERCIVNLSSAAGRHGFPHRSPYAAAKWGVVGFTKSLAVEAGPDKVRVNCILPGIVEGERIERVIAAKAKAHGLSHEEFRRRFLETTSLHATVSAQDIANMVLFLCTPAGARITGQPISVDADVRYLV